MNFLLILLVALASVVGNSFFRAGVAKTQLAGTKPSALLAQLLALLTNPLIIMGLFIFGLGTLLWFYVLSRESLSRAYPIFASSAFIFLVISSSLFLHESVTTQKIIGMMIIVIGIVVVFFIK